MVYSWLYSSLSDPQWEIVFAVLSVANYPIALHHARATATRLHEYHHEYQYHREYHATRQRKYLPRGISNTTSRDYVNFKQTASFQI